MVGQQESCHDGSFVHYSCCNVLLVGICVSWVNLEWCCCRHAFDLRVVGQRDSCHDGRAVARCPEATLSHGNLPDHQCHVLHAAPWHCCGCIHQVTVPVFCPARDSKDRTAATQCASCYPSALLWLYPPGQAASSLSCWS